MKHSIQTTLGMTVTRQTAVWAIATLLASVAPPLLASSTLILQNGLNGYSGTTDAWLDESQPQHNYGGRQTFQIQWNNGVNDTTVLMFNLTGQIPSGQRIVAAELDLYYAASGSMVGGNWVTIQALRLNAGKSWNENVYDDVHGYGVNWNYRDNAQSLPWSGPLGGGWNDTTNDGNGSAKIQATGGGVLGAYEPGSWVPISVTNTVANWYNGTENNGFLLAAVDFGGNGSLAYGVFASRNDTSSSPLYHPKLVITYEPVPEPSPLSLLAVGAWALLSVRHRRSRTS